MTTQVVRQTSAPVNFGGTNATAAATLTGVLPGSRLQVLAYGWGGDVYPEFTASDGTNSYTQNNANSGNPSGGKISATVLHRDGVESGSHTVTVTHSAASGDRYGWFVLQEVTGGKTAASVITACTAKVETGTTKTSTPSITAAAATSAPGMAVAVLMANVSGSDAGIDAASGASLSWVNGILTQDNNAEASGSGDTAVIGDGVTAVCGWGTIAAASRVAAVMVIFEDAPPAVTATEAKPNPARNRPGRGPRSRGKYFRGRSANTAAPAVGGAVWNVTLAESVAMADSVSAIATRPAAVAETVAAGDSVTAVATRVASVAEAATVADSVSSILQTAAAIAESVTAGDALSTGGAVLSAAIAETVAAADAVSAVMTAAAAVAESIAAADQLSALMTAIAALAETVTAGDALSTGGAIYSVNLAESIAAIDSLAAVVARAASIAEAVTPADAMAAIATLAAAVAEALALSDTIATAGTVTASIFESVAVGDTLSVDSGDTAPRERTISIVRSDRRIVIDFRRRSVSLVIDPRLN